jgi:hypothetical protein
MIFTHKLLVKNDAGKGTWSKRHAAKPAAEVLHEAQEQFIANPSSFEPNSQTMHGESMADDSGGGGDGPHSSQQPERRSSSTSLNLMNNEANCCGTVARKSSFTQKKLVCFSSSFLF